MEVTRGQPAILITDNGPEFAAQIGGPPMV